MLLSLKRLFVLLSTLTFLLSYFNVLGILLFPASSVLQVTSSVAAPVEIPGRKLFMDWGFQFNFDLPWNPKSFYDLNTFEDTFDGRKKRTDFQLESHGNATHKWSSLDKYYMGKNGSVEDNKHPSDFSAGELYQSFENLLVSYGFHETCLLRSVCELARHPFADDQQNIITEVLTFLLTPSLHDAFAASENMYHEVYEEAERYGFLGGECSSFYYECRQDIFDGITKIVAAI